MINLDSLKLVIFDVDDTLAVHVKHQWSKDIEERCMYDAILGSYATNDEPLVNEDLKIFIQLCKKLGIRMGLMSATGFFPCADIKCKWVEEKYEAKMTNYCVASHTDKVPTMDIILRALNIPKNHILIVDDCFTTLQHAATSGYMAASPIEVVTYINSTIFQCAES